MEKNLFTGELVRLGADDPEALAEAFSRWGRDSEYMRLLDMDPARMWSVKKTKEWMDKELEKLGSFEQSREFFFTIRTLETESGSPEDGNPPQGRLIGFVSLFVNEWHHGEAWVGIGLGEREYWGKGYGTDAMRLALRYAFQELGLHRVSLGVFEYNPRAIRSYEKAGFRHEGAVRGHLLRDGRRWDDIQMGILREEWEELQGMRRSTGDRGVGE